MTEDDPVPLKAGSEAPPELTRALRALGKDRDAARLARVADKLGALLDAPPPPPTGALRNFLGSKLGITGILAGLAGLGFLAYQLTLGGPAPSAPQPVAQPAPTQPIAAAPSPDLQPPAAAEPAETREPASASPRRTRRHAANTRAPASTTTAATPAAQATPSSAPAAAPRVDPEPATEAAARKPPAPEKPEPERTAPQPEQRSELQLLFEARKALPSQPAAALQLLDEHAARFRNGQLAPEREVLAIEALRKLGRKAEATERLKKFEARYPQSIHLRRLQEKQ